MGSARPPDGRGGQDHAIIPDSVASIWGFTVRGCVALPSRENGLKKRKQICIAKQ